MRSMNFDYGLEKRGLCWPKKNQWLLHIPNVSAGRGINTLPPQKSARPNLSFKEIEIPHVNETLVRPGKPEWKPLPLTLYDLKKNKHPVFSWLKKIYNTQSGRYYAHMDNGFILDAYLELYSGCGNVQETWYFENIWPQNIDFGDLDMGSSEIITCDLSLRYDRAYIVGEY